MQAEHNGPEIARQLGLSWTSINREIHRSKALPTARATDYQACIAQQRSQAQSRAGDSARRKLGSGLEPAVNGLELSDMLVDAVQLSPAGPARDTCGQQTKAGNTGPSALARPAGRWFRSACRQSA